MGVTKPTLLFKLMTIPAKIQATCHRWRLTLTPNVTLGRNLIIGRYTEIDTACGGRVVIGDSVELHSGCKLLPFGGLIDIGDRSIIGPYSIIYGHGGVVIGNDVLIAASCVVIPANHNFRSRDKPINTQGLTMKGVTIESNVWIGHGCTILDGVVVGTGSVVGAGSVITQDVPSNCVVAGVPARVVKYR